MTLPNMELLAREKAVQTRTDLAAFVHALRDDLRVSEDDWENPTLDRYLEALGGSGVVVVANGDSFVVKVSRDLSASHPANQLAPLLGRGGGREALAQGRLTRPAPEAFHEVEAALQ